MTSYDDIFSTEESRQTEQIQQIPIAELHPFKNHPFKVLDDEAMQRTVESVAQFGVLAPLVVRPREEGGYEIISGHRRQHAAELAGLKTLPVIVRNMDDDQAVILRMEGAGPVTGPILMAEIGDVRRFKNKKALVAFAGVDAPPFQSGAFESKSRHVSKRGSPHLRRTLFTVSGIILQLSHGENPVFCFMDKKRSEGKHFYVYMVAGAAKFLRIYYATITHYLRTIETSDFVSS